VTLSLLFADNADIGFTTCPQPGVLFGRDAEHGGRPYVRHDMIQVLDIDPRIARHCLRAGRLQAGG
jgi:hypothetical protein